MGGVRTVSSAELIVVGGAVVDLDIGAPGRIQQIAIRGGSIVEIGDDVTHLRDRFTRILDARGAAVLPGWVDGHFHPVMGLALLDAADLTKCRTPQDIRTALMNHAVSHPDGWLVGWGLDPGVFGPGPVTNTILGDAARPTLVHVFDGHAAIANASALSIAGVTAAPALPGGASVAVDAHGRPTGHLLEEAAVALVTDHLPVLSPSARRVLLAELLLDMASTGLTGGHMMDAKDDALELLEALDTDGRLPMRLRVAPWSRPHDDPSTAAALQGRGGAMWSVEGVKMFLDGSIDGGTAWLSRPDAHGESVTPGWDPDEFDARLRIFHAAGIPTSTHAIGDAAVRHVLDCVARLPGHSLRHRIEHVETVPDDLVPRFAAHGVTASMQPSHATDYTRADGSDHWSRRVGPARAAQGWRCADLLHHGAVVVLGSDWPVAPYDPRLVLHAAGHAAGIHRSFVASGPAGADAEYHGGVTRLHLCAGMGGRASQRTDRGRVRRRSDAGRRRPPPGVAARTSTPARAGHGLRWCGPIRVAVIRTPDRRRR